jgi:phthiocerol/phenolphthiocerol synthesis type-I polyketide synthase E
MARDRGELTRDRSLDVAVTGLAGRFPGSPDIRSWWAALTAGRVLTTRYERDELLEAGVPERLIDDPDYVPVGGRLADADRFDNTLFRVSPREAELMDPQHRLMLECVWAAMEDAATPPLDGAPTTAVFASITGSGYMRSMVAAGPLDPATLDDVVHGTEPDFVASRIAYKLGLTGPALAVQTACSSSLVAVHLAVQALLNGDCDQAAVVAAGIGYPQAGYLYLPGGILSASGACRPFDESADGVVGGAGVACVILRRLADALEDGPEPYGVILGTAINNDGASKVGYYAPSVAGQEAVIAAALEAADVDAPTIGYLETHGTGTKIGDPIEWSAASAELKRLGAAPGQIAVGALKANIGHTDAAAGLSGLIKALLVVKEGVVPPVAGFTRLNPLLEAEGSPLYVPTEAASWTGPMPRRAGVSSFGVGGTNAHAIVEQAPKLALAPPTPDGRPRLVLLSAADGPTLSRIAARLAEHLVDRRPDVADVSLTLAAGRAELSERLAVAGGDSAAVADRLTNGHGVAVGSRPAAGTPPSVFLFPGQGSQYPGMAAPYGTVLPTFQDGLDRCLDAFEPALASRLRRALLDPDFPAEELDQTFLAQPALFAVGHAAATALSALGVAPAAVIGHSLGEITAACYGRAFDLADAARFVTVRGAAMQACRPGAMLALGCDEEQARELAAAAGAEVEMAAVNAPEACVVAGTSEAADAFQSWLGGRIFSRRLRTSHAFHSALVEPAVEQLVEELDAISLRPLELPIAVNVTGQIVPAGTQIEPRMFAEQARSTARFGDAMAAIADRFPDAVVVDLGPGRALSATAEDLGLTAVPLCPVRRADGDEDMLAALGGLWTLGLPVAVAELCGSGRRIHLPTYAFEGPRWIAPEARPSHPRRDEPPAEPEEPAPPAESDAAADGVAVVDVPTVVGAAWAEVLGHDDLSDDSDFFHLGGDSLLITRLARAVNRELGIRVPIRQLLVERTLGRQTAIVTELVRTAGTESG